MSIEFTKGKWRIKGTEQWIDSQLFVDLKKGEYFIEFLPVDRYIGPTEIYINLTEDTELDVLYVARKGN